MILSEYIKNSDDMVIFGAKISQLFNKGNVVYLDGILGAGKTTLMKGILEYHDYKGHVLSPTYTLFEEYDLNDFFIYHYDLYRLSDPEELEWIGVRDNFDLKNISFIEWAEKGYGYIPKADFLIKILYKETGRLIKIYKCF